MMMTGRKFEQPGGSYRYSINGQEKEKELNENITTAEFWMYDSRIGRRWNVDPELKTWNSAYSCFDNNPIINIDPDGNTDFYSNGRWIGSDGYNNGLIVIVKDRKIAASISKNTLEGHCSYLNFTQLLSIIDKPGGKVDNFNFIYRQVLSSAFNVLNQQISTKNNLTEHSVSLINPGLSYPPSYIPIGEGHSGRLIRLRNGQRRVQGAAALDGVDVGIHGHPLKTIPPVTDVVSRAGSLYAQLREGTGLSANALEPTSCAGTAGGDKCITNNKLNIIVGANGYEQITLNRTTNKLQFVGTRTLSINLFSSNWTPLFQISRLDAQKMLSPNWEKIKFDSQQRQFKLFVQRFTQQRRLQQNQP